ncbi:hypothetical protein [Salinivibrio sp. ML323]|uniref:hypothetical protein n=1 Tax=Salinivibrio sp. ML323 TaxID=1909474 RepID=UPI003FCF5D9F
MQGVNHRLNRLANRHLAKLADTLIAPCLLRLRHGLAGLVNQADRFGVPGKVLNDAYRGGECMSTAMKSKRCLFNGVMTFNRSFWRIGAIIFF